MTRKRILIGGLAAGIVAIGLLFGGVFSGGEERPSLPAAVPPNVIAGQDVNEALRQLLQGFSTGDTAAFVRKLERAVEENAFDINSLTVLGLAYQQRQRETGDARFLTLSENALRRAVELRQDQPLATTGLASLAVTRHRFDDALTLARRSLDQNPEDATAYGVLGDALLSLGRYEEAFREFDRLAEMSPSIASFARVAYARELLGRPDEAAEAIRLTFELSQNVPEYEAWARVQLGNVYFSTGRLDKAESAYRRALAGYPRYLHAEAGLARVEAAREEYGSAVERLRQVVEILPLPQYAILLGDVLTAAGREPEARDAYAVVDVIQRLLEANGVRTEAQTALFDLDHDRKLADALARAEEAYQAAPFIVTEDVLSWALYKNGRCEEARTYSRQALRLGTLDALLLFHRGMIEQCLGNEAAAQRYIERALEINPSFSFLYAPVAREMVA